MSQYLNKIPKSSGLLYIAKKHSAPKPDVIKSLQDFTLGVNMKTPNMSFLSRRQVLIRTISSTKLMIRFLRRSCAHVNISWWILSLKVRDTVFNYAVDSQQYNRERELDHFFNNLKCAAKVNVAFGFILKNIEDGGFRYFYAHQNNTLLDRSELVCTKDHLANIKDFLYKTDVIETCSRERMNKVEFVRVDKLNYICCFTQRCTYGVVSSLTRTTFEKLHKQLS